MFWDDIKSIKSLMQTLSYRMTDLEMKMDQIIQGQYNSDFVFQAKISHEDYMKNVDKLNGMINEFKGCVSMARGAIADRKQLSEQEGKTETLADKLENKFQSRLDAIYKAICKKEKKKTVKKKSDPETLPQ